MRDVGLTLGDLRAAVGRIEEIVTTVSTPENEEELESEAMQLTVHVLGMALIQIAQELNEIKNGLLEERQEKRPYIR